MKIVLIIYLAIGVLLGLCGSVGQWIMRNHLVGTPLESDYSKVKGTVTTVFLWPYKLTYLFLFARKFQKERFKYWKPKIEKRLDE